MQLTKPMPAIQSEANWVYNNPEHYDNAEHQRRVARNIRTRHLLAEYKRDPSSVDVTCTAVVRNVYGEFLILEHAKTGLWTMAGGAVEPNEKPVDAMRREVWEELDVCDIELLNEGLVLAGAITEQCLHFCYEVRLPTQWKNKEPHKHPNIGYVPKERLHAEYLTESAYLALVNTVSGTIVAGGL